MKTLLVKLAQLAIVAVIGYGAFTTFGPKLTQAAKATKIASPIDNVNKALKR